MEYLLVIVLIVIVYFYLKSKKNIDTSAVPKQFIVFDLETTGLNSNQHEIIEIGAIKVNMDSNEHQTFQALIKPKKKIPVKITEITNITQEMLDKDGDDIENVLKDFLEFIGDLRLVTYNSDFDMSFLRKAAKEQNIKINNSVSCALKMSRRAWKDLDSYKLADIAKMGGFSTKGSHRALKDCEMALTVYTSAAHVLNSDH